MFIYILHCGGIANLRTKIGISCNPERRATMLRVGTPFNLRLVKYWEIPDADARDIEKEVHALLKPKRVNGEWFRCTDGDAMDAVLKVLYRRRIKRWPSEIEREAAESGSGDVT